jgi:hypothetical protein
MSIGTKIPPLLTKIDKLLEAQGLYVTVNFTDTTNEISNYDPITATYSTESSALYSFKGVLIEKSLDNQSENSYGGGTQLIVIPDQISFDVAVDQVYTINEQDWKVESFTIAPLDSVYTINLRRK